MDQRAPLPVVGGHTQRETATAGRTHTGITQTRTLALPLHPPGPGTISAHRNDKKKNKKRERIRYPSIIATETLALAIPAPCSRRDSRVAARRALCCGGCNSFSMRMRTSSMKGAN